MLTRVKESWEALAPVRERRLRCKQQAFGQPAAGNIGNNLTRQLIKSIIGWYMHLRREGDAFTAPGKYAAADARGLEEFLISGMVFQRKCEDGEVVNVSPERVAFERFERPDGGDCRLFGMLHDFDRGEMVRAFSQRDPHTVHDLMNLFERKEIYGAVPPTLRGEIGFDVSDKRECVRVVEVWRHESLPVMHCHDTLCGEYMCLECTESNLNEFEKMNDRRLKGKKPVVEATLGLRECWVESWFTGDGKLLRQEVHENDEAFPFVMAFYPFIDGEVHSLVEDVMPQQQLVDRMVTLLDKVVANSAKGVLLFPADQLPEGFTWRDMRRIWSDPGGVIPYRRTSRTVMPQQVSTAGWVSGAADMLKMQLDLFDQVAGVSGSLRGKDVAGSRGAEALQRQTENCMVGMTDILSAYDAFIARRNVKFEKKGAGR